MTGTGLAVVSAALLLLSFPRFDMHYLAWVGFVPLYFALGGGSGRRRFLYGYLFGLVFLGLLMWWITVVRYPAPVGYAAGLLVIPVVFGAWGVAAGAFLRRDSRYPLFLMPGVLWVALEYLASLGPFALPWWSLGYSQSLNLPAAQAASAGGMYAVSFLVTAVNGVVYTLASGGWRRREASVIVVSVAVAAVFVWGLWVVSKPSGGGRRAGVAVVQGNFKQEEKEDPRIFATIYEEHMRLTADAVRRHDPDVVVWSETIAEYDWIAGETMLPYMLDSLEDMGIMLVAGVYDRRGEMNYNSVVVLSPVRGYLGKYDKMHLVPFGEYVPGRNRLGRFPRLREWVDKNIYLFDTSPGRNPVVFETEHGKLSTIICFESTLPQIARKMTALGAELLLVLTNDAWFEKSAAADQHAAMGVLRAIENRRFVVQGASTGISVIVDPVGRRIASSKLFRREIVYGNVRFRGGRSFYTRFGDVFSWAMLLVSVSAPLMLKRFGRAGRRSGGAKKPRTTGIRRK
ncbi:MAG: apolipoprotein N-acyltransferase [bacterium]